MKLSDIFASKDLTSKEQVEAIAQIVTTAREAYGNSDKKIASPEITTINGLEDLAMLSDESKVAIAASEVQNIKLVAYEYTKSYDGASLSKKVEELIAISPLLANIATSVDCDYL